MSSCAVPPALAESDGPPQQPALGHCMRTWKRGGGGGGGGEGREEIRPKAEFKTRNIIAFV